MLEFLSRMLKKETKYINFTSKLLHKASRDSSCQTYSLILVFCTFVTSLILFYSESIESALR